MRNGYSDPTANIAISKIYREWQKAERERKAKEERKKEVSAKPAKRHISTAA